MTTHASIYAPVHETPRTLFLVFAALLAVLPLVLYVAIHHFDAPIFSKAWVAGFMPGWPLALFFAILGLPNSRD